jgi:hypothetical protein
VAGRADLIPELAAANAKVPRLALSRFNNILSVLMFMHSHSTATAAHKNSILTSIVYNMDKKNCFVYNV